MTQKQRETVVKEIVPKRLKLVRREWTKVDGSTGSSFRARVWHHKRKKYNYISLKAQNVTDASIEAIDLYVGLKDTIEKNLPIAADARKLEYYIAVFMEHMEIRAKNGKITPKRVVILRQLLRSLEKFYDSHGTPAITDLPLRYEEKYEAWRDKSLTRLTARPLTPRSRNNEYNAHRQFFGFLKDRGIVGKVPDVNLQKVTQTNHPFPKEKYNKLMKVSRDAIAKQKNPKTKWNWQCMRSVILLMNGTGCRVTEARNLRWKDITLDTKKKPRLYLHGKSKEREISISPRVYGHLEELREFKRVYGEEWQWNDKDYELVFASWKMKKCPNQFDSRGRRQWYEQSGLDPKEFPLVCFRHKFISDALRNGTQALQIAFYCGTSVQMIQQTYGKITPPDLYDQVFAGTSDQALARHDTSRWFAEMLEEKLEKTDKLKR